MSKIHCRIPGNGGKFQGSLSKVFPPLLFWEYKLKAKCLE